MICLACFSVGHQGVPLRVNPSEDQIVAESGWVILILNYNEEERVSSIGSCGSRGVRDHNRPQEIKRHAFECVCPFEYRLVLTEVMFADSAKQAEEIA